MGLPQVSSKLADEEPAPLNTFVSSPSRFGGITTCDLDGLHIENTDNRTNADILCPSIGDFQRKTVLELPAKTTVDIPVNHQTPRIGSTDKNGYFPSLIRRNIHIPLSRVVGFESSKSDLLVNGFESVSSNKACSSAAMGVCDSSIDSQGLQVRKRLLSPLNGMVVQDMFNGELLNLAESNNEADSSLVVRGDLLPYHDSKKANTGNGNCSQTPIRPSYGFSKLSEMLDKDASNSCIYTDGLLLDTKEHLYALGTGSCADTFNRRAITHAIALSPKKINSPPLSLSPLGPKWSERMRAAESCTYISKEFQGIKSFSKNMALDESISGILFASEEVGFRIENDPIENIDSMQNDLYPFILQNHSHIDQNWGPDSAPTPRCFKFGRNLGGLPVRRSLIGSFEESLLSGRFSSSKVSQKIDGFLAVLKVTGGSFSPPMQKLPFSVTSVDGDSYLLYYASIDLVGNLPANNCGGPKMIRSLSNEDPCASRTRLRIPMKGCIQLNYTKEE